MSGGLLALGWVGLGWVVGLTGCITEWLFSVYGYWARAFGFTHFLYSLPVLLGYPKFLDGDRKTDLNIGYVWYASVRIQAHSGLMKSLVLDLCRVWLPELPWCWGGSSQAISLTTFPKTGLSYVFE